MIEGSLSSDSMGKIARWYNARRAAGIQVQPWELEKAYEGEMSALVAKKQQANQFNQGLEEKQRQFNINTDLENQILAERKRQFGLNQNQADLDRRSKETTGLLSAGTNALTTAAMLYGRKYW